MFTVYLSFYCIDSCKTVANQFIIESHCIVKRTFIVLIPGMFSAGCLGDVGAEWS